MTPGMFGNVGMIFYDSKRTVDVNVEKIPPMLAMPGQPAMIGYYRVQFSNGMSTFYLLVNRQQLLELCDDLDAESSDYLAVNEEASEPQ